MMNRPEFETRLDGLGITQTVFAEITGLDRKTVYGWGKERNTGGERRAVQAVPSWVSALLDAWTIAPRALQAAIKRLG